MVKHRYGWRKDRTERVSRYRLVSLTAPGAVYPPVDLRGRFPLPPFDQGDLGSCTANAIDGLRTFDLARSGRPAAAGSRLFQYFNERAIEGDTQQDGGATIADSVEAWERYGICAEAEWPYDTRRFAARPSAQCYADAKPQAALDYSRVDPSLPALYACLAAGYPVIFGINVYESFEGAAAATTGAIPIPDMRTEALLGGHALVLCGIDVQKNVARFRNSWGTQWGDGGYGTLPLREYLLNSQLASDFWVVRQVGPAKPVIENRKWKIKNATPLNVLVVGGFLEHVGDSSPIWQIADALMELGCPVTRRAWDELATNDLAGVDVIVDYSWGKAAVWDKMYRLPPESRPTIRHEFTIAGVPCPLFGQFDCDGKLWTIPGNILAATDYQVDSFPVSCRISNPSANYLNVDCDGPGVNHRTICALPSVREGIVEGVRGLL